MVRPDHFAFNTQTAPSNTFQHNPESQTQDQVQKSALGEFETMVTTLQGHGINVIVGENTESRNTPDEVFPNNWFSTHEDGTLIYYPMLALNRRLERQSDPKFMQKLRTQGHFQPKRIKDLSVAEEHDFFLEGTGSLILDRKNKIAYAHESPRTSVDALRIFSEMMGYQATLFQAKSRDRKPIYHTNVVMSIEEKFSVICSEVVRDKDQKKLIVEQLARDREVIEITEDQMSSFCANIIELSAPDGSIIVMSETAKNAFTQKQLRTLKKYGKPVAVKIPTIETVGGGSARCMVSEIFPNKKLDETGLLKP